MAYFLTRGLTLQQAAQYAVAYNRAEKQKNERSILDTRVEKAIADVLSLRSSQEIAEAPEHQTLVPRPLTTPTANYASLAKSWLARASSRFSRAVASTAAVFGMIGIAKNRPYPVPPRENCYHGSAVPWVNSNGDPLRPGDTVQVTGPLFVATESAAGCYANGTGVSISSTAEYNPNPGALYRFRIIPRHSEDLPMRRGLLGGQFYCDATPQNPITIIVEEVHLVEKVPYEDSAAAATDI